MHRIVVWDPSGRTPEGSLVEGPRGQLRAENGGVAFLPVDVDLIERPPNGGAGYVRRAWGAGVELAGPAVARRVCPFIIWADADRGFLNWAVRIESIDVAPPTGLLRLTSDTGQRGTIAGGLSADGPPIDISRLGSADRWGGWTATGRHRIATAIDGFIGVSLYGTAQGARVMWTAATQTREGD